MARGKVTPEEFQDEVISCPKLRGQLPIVKVKADAEFEKPFPKIQPCRVEIETNGGKVLDRRVDLPKGDPRDR